MFRVRKTTQQRDSIILAHLRKTGSVTKHDARLISHLRAAGCRVGINPNKHLAEILASMWVRKLVERRKSAPYMDTHHGTYTTCWEYVLKEEDK